MEVMVETGATVVETVGNNNTPTSVPHPKRPSLTRFYVPLLPRPQHLIEVVTGLIEKGIGLKSLQDSPGHREEDPTALERLKDHVAIVVHPSKKFFKKRRTSKEADGSTSKWFR